MFRILVTGAGGTAAYNYVMSLRNNPNNEDFYIVGCDTNKYHIELCPLDKAYKVPSVNSENYIKDLNAIIEKEKIDFIHVQPDIEVSFLSGHYKELKTKSRLPQKSTIEICQNKLEFNEFLKKEGFIVPESYLVDSEKILYESVRKILNSNDKAWIRAIRGAGSKGALPIRDAEHGKFWIDYWTKMKGIGYGDFMVSEFLPGKEYAFQSIWENGEIIMSQCRERVEYLYGFLSPSGQSSTPSVARTVSNEKINQDVTKIIKKIDPNATGIFCADLKEDKNGNVLIMEINAGRFFTTSYFFSYAGCNMPYYHTLLGLGREIDYNGPKYNCLPDDLYWVRMVDMGYKLVKDNEWLI